MSIFLTGSTGFVGINLIKFFRKKKTIYTYERNSEILIKDKSVIHLAGKAHDIKKKLSVKEYYEVNTELTKKIFDAFIKSESKVFIFLSSVKAVADTIEGELDENHIANPLTHYGKSKLLAEKYIQSIKIPKHKRVYILRPCIIHGPGNKGNLNLLFKLVSKGFPWPLGSFNNKRSFCSIDNLLFVINELIINKNISSGVYNIADDEPLSTNEIISLIYKTKNKKPMIWNVSKILISLLAKVGDKIKLPLNSEKLNKLTESYLVSNKKLIDSLGKALPVKSVDGLMKTFKTFNIN